MTLLTKGQEVESILVFGADDHVGGPIANFIAEHMPNIKLKVATSNQLKVERLELKHPAAEVVVANYFDIDSMVNAFKGVTGIFVITPDFFNEITAMGNLVAAIRRSPSVNHIVRIAADTPGMTLEKLPKELYEMGPGPAHQHFEAQTVLNASGLDVTHLNSCGYYMDDFIIHFAPPLKEQRKLIVPYERQMCFTDTNDLAEVGARLLIEGPEKHGNQYYDFNSGEPPRTFASVAELLSEVTGETITYDPAPESFRQAAGPLLRELTGTDRAANYFIVNWQMERDNQHAFFASSFGERILGRKPRTLKKWLVDHKDQLL